jgi:hypothetical protein
MNNFGIARAARRRKEKGWDKTYWCIDMHDVLVTGNYDKENHKWEFAPNVLAVLSWLSDRKDHVLILWTSSYKNYTDTFLGSLQKYMIYFDYINENPECPSTDLADFNSKFYFDILLDDKAGFEKDTDWEIVWSEIVNNFIEDEEKLLIGTMKNLEEHFNWWKHINGLSEF